MSSPVVKAHKSIIITLVYGWEELEAWAGGEPGHCRAVVDLGAAPSLLPWCFALGIEDGLQWLCPKCFSAVLVNQAESLL